MDARRLDHAGLKAPGGLRVEARRSLAELRPLAARLDALNLASRRPSPFDTFAYLESFVASDEYEEPGRELLLLVAFDGEEPVGFLPLRRERERVLGVPYRAIRFLVSHDNDRPRVVARREDEARCAAAFYRYLLVEDRGWSLLVLGEQDADSCLSTPPAALLGGYYERTFPNNPNGTMLLPYATLAEYLASFSREHRRPVERSVRRLVAAGELELVSSRDPAAVPGLFDLYLDLERRSWKAKVGGHIGRHPRRVAFFRSLLAPSQPMRLGVHLLMLDGVPIAGVVTGAFEGGLYGLEIAFDEGYRDLSPGNAVLLLLIGDAIKEGRRFLDMLGNYSYYKARWGAAITETRALQLFRKGSLVHLKALGGEVLRRLRPPVTQEDVAFNLARKDAPADEEESPGKARPDRREARERARAALSALEASGAPLTRLDVESLARLLPFAIRRPALGARRRAPEARP